VTEKQVKRKLKSHKITHSLWRRPLLEEAVAAKTIQHTCTYTADPFICSRRVKLVYVAIRKHGGYGRGSGRKAGAVKYLADGLGGIDGGQNRHGAAATIALENVQGEHSADKFGR
jgi:hypothetical protein